MASTTSEGACDGLDPAGNESPPLPARQRRVPAEVTGLAVLAAIAVLGTFLVKWQPYYLKGFRVAANHTLGPSPLSGGPLAPPGWRAAYGYASAYARSVWPALVVGLLVAAGVQELLPRDLVGRLLGRARYRETMIATAVAVPSMMCTCCSAPATVALARRHASVGATLAYWLANPVLNPATIVFTGLVLGWHWAGLRLGVGLALVLGVAWLAERRFGGGTAADPGPALRQSDPLRPADDRCLARRYLAALGRLGVGLVPEYAVAVLALGSARAFLFPALTPALAHSWWFVVLLAITGTLFVVPTAGEVPIVATLLSLGLGRPAGGALLLTLPAISLPSLVMVGRALPGRVLALATGAVVVAGLSAAVLTAAWGP